MRGSYLDDEARTEPSDPPGFWCSSDLRVWFLASQTMCVAQRTPFVWCYLGEPGRSQPQVLSIYPWILTYRREQGSTRILYDMIRGLTYSLRSLPDLS